MINAKIFIMLKKMTPKETSAYVNSLANRISASIDLGGRTIDGKVVFSKGMAWVPPNRDEHIMLTSATLERLSEAFGDREFAVDEKTALRLLDSLKEIEND